MAAAAHRRMIAWSSAAPTRPGCGRYAPVRASAVIWSPARTSIRSTSQGREQLAVRRDGLPLQREMGAVISFRQVAQAHPGQPGQPSRRASRLHQAGDAVTVGQLGGPQQHPVPGQDPQPGRGGTAGIDQNTARDGNMARHSTSPQIWHRPGTQPSRDRTTEHRQSLSCARQDPRTRIHSPGKAGSADVLHRCHPKPLPVECWVRQRATHDRLPHALFVSRGVRADRVLQQDDHLVSIWPSGEPGEARPSAAMRRPPVPPSSPASPG